MQSVIELINHYGYIILFAALLLELIAFPLPGELMMTYCGFLVYESKLNWLLSILVAAAGAASGITLSYFAGTKLGAEFFKRYGHYIHLGPERLEKTSNWFKAYGNKLLILAYFIPGVRHITGYFSGITQISYKKFAVNAYLGAVIWASTFISLGKVLGPNWEKFHSAITKYLIIGSLIISIILVIIYSYKNHRTQVIGYANKMLNKTMTIFNTLGKIRVAMAVTAAAFLGFFILLIGTIQDYLAHEFGQFDFIVSYLVKAIFTNEWTNFIGMFQIVTSIKILVSLSIIIAALIIKRNKDRMLELLFLCAAISGGEVLQFVLRYAFRRLGPYSNTLLGTNQYTFPSEESFIAIAAYGFFMFLIIRHTRKAWIKTALMIVTIIICILSGLNPIFFQREYPSDVYAGYIFGGAWLTINIILLEVYRILPKIQ